MRGSIIASLDVMWLGSEYEGQSNAILEAMSAGIPVVASDIPGNRDLVVNDQTGFLVPLGDRAAFATQTRVFLEDPEIASRFGNAGKLRVESEFSVQKMIQRHQELYRELLG